MEALCWYAEQASQYENDLLSAKQEVETHLALFQSNMESAIDAGEDRDALEYVRIMVRLRPQVDLLNYELRAFHAVSSALILRTSTLVSHMDEAREYAQSATLNPAATDYLDKTMDKLTRYFVMLERVAGQRRRELPDRLAALMGEVIDNRKLDMELANYILARRRGLGTGR
jgi:hypothetical protein